MSTHGLFLLLTWMILSTTANKHLGAQTLTDQWRISFLVTKVTSDPLDSRRFFNSTSISLQYNKSLVPNIDGIIGLGFLHSIETEGRQTLDVLDQALDRFQKSYLNFDLGIALIPIRFAKSDIRLGLGSSIRQRMEVRTRFATQSSDGVLVKNEFSKSWDYGGFSQLEYSRVLFRNWFAVLSGQLRTYNKGDSVLGIGLSIGQEF